jgi:serine/threonine kinase PknH
MKVFVSYSRRDETAVRSLVDALHRARDVDLWLDEELGGGEAWWTAILEQIWLCTVFVVALSDNALNSKPCQAELGYAQALGLPVLPLQVGDVASYRLDPIFVKQLVDYRTPSAATAITLMDALRDLERQHKSLPDQLPDPPPIPYEYLQRLGASIRDSSTVLAPLPKCKC